MGRVATRAKLWSIMEDGKKANCMGLEQQFGKMGGSMRVIMWMGKKRVGGRIRTRMANGMWGSGMRGSSMGMASCTTRTVRSRRAGGSMARKTTRRLRAEISNFSIISLSSNKYNFPIFLNNFKSIITFKIYDKIYICEHSIIGQVFLFFSSKYFSSSYKN